MKTHDDLLDENKEMCSFCKDEIPEMCSDYRDDTCGERNNATKEMISMYCYSAN